MEKIGSIEIRIEGSNGNLDLSPDNYDIQEVISMLKNAEGLFYSGGGKERPTISYQIEEGSVRHIFKTSMQLVIAFNAIIGQVIQSQDINFLDIKTAQAFENIQDIAAKKDYSFTIKTSLSDTNEINLDGATHFYRTESIWVDAEFYFYGKVTNAGGKDNANIHLLTEELGTIIIKTPQDFLENYKENLLYKTFGIRAAGKQHLDTGEIDKTRLEFIELVNYQPQYDEQYLRELRDRAKKKWLGINPEKWLREIRGGYGT